MADFGGHDDWPELADIPRITRRLIRWAVQATRAEEAPVQRVLREHLGPDMAGFSVVSGSWQGYDLVNVQVGLNGWLEGWRREHELVGLTGFQHSATTCAATAGAAST